MWYDECIWVTVVTTTSYTACIDYFKNKNKKSDNIEKNEFIDVFTHNKNEINLNVIKTNDYFKKYINENSINSLYKNLNFEKIAIDYTENSEKLKKIKMNINKYMQITTTSNNKNQNLQQNNNNNDSDNNMQYLNLLNYLIFNDYIESKIFGF